MAKRIDRDNEPYRPIISVPKEKIDELFSLINMMDTQQVKQFSIINSVSLNVDSSIGDNLIHKVITLNNGLKKEMHRLNMIKFLYQNGVNPDKPNRENQTPLHLACKEQYFSIVEFLVSIGVDLNFKDNIGFTPFHYALMGKIELYNEPKEIKEFIEKPKQIDFGKKDELINIKKEMWEKIKDNDFISAISKTVDDSIYSNENIRRNVLNFTTNLSKNILKIKKENVVQLVKEEIVLMKKGIESIVSEIWGDFKDINELTIHEKDKNSWILENNDLSPLKNINVRETIRNVSIQSKEKIKEICVKIQKESDKGESFEIKEKWREQYIQFYNKFIDENLKYFDKNNIGVPINEQFTLKTSKNISDTNWNEFNSNHMDPLAIDFADNVIDWDDMTFIGGSREIKIDFDIEIIKTILGYDTIEQRVLHILSLLDDKPMSSFDKDNIDTSIKNDGITYVIDITKDYDIVSIALPYDLIFKKDHKYNANTPIGIEQYNKWKKLFNTKDFASVLYCQICSMACLQNSDNLTGSINSVCCALVLAIKLSSNNLTIEHLDSAFKKYYISYCADITKYTQDVSLFAIVNILLTNKLTNDPDDYFDNTKPELTDIKDSVDSLITITNIPNKTPEQQIEFTNKKNDLIKLIMKKINEMSIKPTQTDILQVITYISNDFEFVDRQFFNLNEDIFDNIFNITNLDKYSDESINNYINKFIHIIKKRQTTFYCHTSIIIKSITMIIDKSF